MGLSALLAGGASQHAGHRERGDVGRHRLTSPAGTSTIRVGAGGVMLPNHAPLVIAEQFGTLESLYPGRIDLGLGRAPGTDQITARALRRDAARTPTPSPTTSSSCSAYLRASAAGAARPRGARRGSAACRSGCSARACSARSSRPRSGLPFAFASHFAPDSPDGGAAAVSRQFTPSAPLAQPYAMVGVNVFAAETDAEAQRLFTSLQQQFINLRRGRPGQLPPPVDSTDGSLDARPSGRASSTRSRAPSSARRTRCEAG